MQLLVSHLGRIPDINARINRAFVRRARQLGFEALSVRDMAGPELLRLSKLADGVFAGRNLPDILRTGLPTVWMREMKGAEFLLRVVADDEASARILLDHLEEERLVRYGMFVSLDARDYRQQSQGRAFAKLARERGREVDVFTDAPAGDAAWTYAGQLRDLERWLAGLEKPVGIFAGDEEHACRVRIACRRAGLACPEDVAIVAGEVTPEPGAPAEMSITGVLGAFEREGEMAAEMLAAEVRGQPIADRVQRVPPLGLFRGHSSDRRFLNQPLVRRAIRFVESVEFHRRSVDEISRQLRVSKPTLNRQFRSATGQPTARYLKEHRLREGLRLLQGTRVPVVEISEKLGYEYLAQFSRDIRRFTGKSPREWRR